MFYASGFSRWKKRTKHIIPLSANPTKWSNTLKQFVGPQQAELYSR